MRSFMIRATAAGRREVLTATKRNVANHYEGLAYYENGILVLASPETENKLTPDMVDGIYAHIHKGLQNPLQRASVMRGGPSYFSKGMSLHHMLHDVDHVKNVYQLIYYLAHVNKPFVSFMDGHAEDFGVGLGLASWYGVSTDASNIGFPSVQYGLVPPGGSTHFLSKASGDIGMMLALGGERLIGEHIYLAGISRLFSKYDRGGVLGRLFMTSSADEAGIDHAIQMMCEVPEYDHTFQQRLDRANELYGGNSVEHILYELQVAGETQQVRHINDLSPTVAKVLFRLLKEAKKLDLKACMELEFRINYRLRKQKDILKKEKHGLNIASCHNPEALSDVSDDYVDSFFQPLEDPSEELNVYIDYDRMFGRVEPA